MEFFDVYRPYLNLDLPKVLDGISAGEVETVIGKEKLTPTDFLVLLSQAARDYLESLAQKAHALTVKHFGKVIYLYTPMYLSNYCTNVCLYCGFNVTNHLKRRTLTLDEIEEEGRLVAQTGLRHLLILTGESPTEAPVRYIAESAKRLKKFFSSVSIEVYPLETDDYRTLFEAGVDGMTIYQETYDPMVYDRVHLKGPKKNYLFRLNAPERACKAGLRTVNLGSLLGLTGWRSEVLALGLHAKYLQDHYPGTEISVSFPRLRPAPGQYQPAAAVSDPDLVQMLLAVRLFLPRVGITISTRESSEFRNNLIPLGVTKMSAGSCTEVGGRLNGNGEAAQFDISDTRSVDEMKEAILKRGYQPVYKDWLAL